MDLDMRGVIIRAKGTSDFLAISGLQYSIQEKQFTGMAQNGDLNYYHFFWFFLATTPSILCTVFNSLKKKCAVIIFLSALTLEAF